MSCEHGNWPPCDQCDALDERWNDGFKAGCGRVEKLLRLLSECDAAIVMLGGSYPAKKLRDEIAKATGEQP